MSKLDQLPMSATTTLHPPKPPTMPTVIDDSMPDISYYIVKFEHEHLFGTKASCIGLVPKNSTNDWNTSVFYTAASFSNRQTVVEPFNLNSKEGWGRQSILEALNNARYMVFSDGQMVEIFHENIPNIVRLIHDTKPMFDEYALIETLMENPASVTSLMTPNSFGTWADVVLYNIAEMSESKLGWKMIGGDPRLMPKKDKRLEFQTKNDPDYIPFEE